MLFASASAFEESPYSMNFYNSDVMLNGDGEEEKKPAKKAKKGKKAKKSKSAKKAKGAKAGKKVSSNGYPRPEGVLDLEPGTY